MLKNGRWSDAVAEDRLFRLNLIVARWHKGREGSDSVGADAGHFGSVFRRLWYGFQARLLPRQAFINHVFIVQKGKQSLDMNLDEIDSLASHFIAAIQKRDLDTVRDLYSPSAKIWHNVTGRTQTREENLALLAAFTSRVNQLRYEEIERNIFEDGYAQRHVVRGVLDSGVKVEIPAALIVYVAEARIVRLFEYIDAAVVAPVFA